MSDVFVHIQGTEESTKETFNFTPLDTYTYIHVYIHFFFSVNIHVIEFLNLEIQLYKNCSVLFLRLSDKVEKLLITDIDTRIHSNTDKTLKGGH